MSLKRIAVIVAGGSGKRMGSDTPKQFLPIDGRPVLMHTLERFSFSDETVLVLPADQLEQWGRLIRQHDFRLPHRTVAGGASRYESVRNGLAGIHGDAVVAVHDGVRPLASRELIQRCFEEAAFHGTAIPAVTIPDSIRSLAAGMTRPEDRSKYIAIQTPQCFHAKYIPVAYGVEERAEFTDDASVLEAAGIALRFTEGERWNIKITFAEDLRVAEALIRQ